MARSLLPSSQLRLPAISRVPVQGDLGHQRHLPVYFHLEGEEEVFLPGTETRKSRGEAEILAEIPISTREFCVSPFVPVRTAAPGSAACRYVWAIPGDIAHRCLDAALPGRDRAT